jgi:hypothetical protein
LTAAEVRTEFGVLALCMLGQLALVRPFLLAEPVFLAGSVGLFALGGLVATALSRQDAADVASAGSGRALAATTAVMPIGLAVILVSILRPAVLGVMWTTTAKIIELVLTPIGWLLAWLASLFPQGGPPAALPQIVRPTPQALPNPADLGDLQDRMEWIRWVVLITLLIAGALAVLIVARLLLANWIGSPTRAVPETPADLTVERTGTAGGTAHDLLGWLMRWLRGRLGRRAAVAGGRGGIAEVPAADAWAAYRSMLEWAESRGLGRRPAETTGQLQSRLARHAPELTEAVDLVTSTYAWERYGQIAPVADRLRRVRQALAALLGRPS